MLYWVSVLYFMVTPSSDAKTNSFCILVIKQISFLFRLKFHANLWYSLINTICCIAIGSFRRILHKIVLTVVNTNIFDIQICLHYRMGSVQKKELE